jgi:DNA-directed RNA polymerase specialized sigma24 family protein
VKIALIVVIKKLFNDEEKRRSKVVELRSRGLSYVEIAQQLQVSRASIGSDVQYLREQAKDYIKEYVPGRIFN